MVSALAIGLAVGLGVPLALIVGGVLGYIIATKIIKKQIKKNPPITKDTIRMMYQQIGRKPTEKQINEIYNRAVKQ